MPSLGSMLMLAKNVSGKSRTARLPISSSTPDDRLRDAVPLEFEESISTGSPIASDSHLGTFLNM